MENIVETHTATGIEYVRTFLYSKDLIEKFFTSISPTEFVMLKRAVEKGLILFFTNDTEDNHAFFSVGKIDGKPTPVIGMQYAGCEAQEDLAVLFHELVHFEQWDRGDLHYDEANNVQFWQGNAINREEIAYRDLPQEVEAWDRQYDFLCMTGKLKSYLPRWMNEIVILKRLQVSSNAVKHRIF